MEHTSTEKQREIKEVKFSSNIIFIQKEIFANLNLRALRASRNFTFDKIQSTLCH